MKWLFPDRKYRGKDRFGRVKSIIWFLTLRCHLDIQEVEVEQVLKISGNHCYVDGSKSHAIR